MATKKRQDTSAARGEVLVAIMNNRRDFGILQEQGWYRIPVESAPRRWPPQWLAFYQTQVFGDEAHAVHFYARVRSIRKARRSDLFPGELPNPKSDRLYYQIHLEALRRLPNPIVSPRWRRILFIPTTWAKFTRAKQLNDLFDDSPLEDLLWSELKQLDIPAERQWLVQVGEKNYLLDFAVFCNDGSIAIETDGDSYHVGVEPAAKDRRRDNDLTTAGWRILRFNGAELKERMAEYCIPEITSTVNRLGSLLAETEETRRVFYTVGSQTVQQLGLFEPPSEYSED